MSSTTYTLFIVLWIFTTMLTVDGTSRQNKLYSLEDYLDFHINKIRMKRQVPSLTNKETTSSGPIAMNERNPTAEIHSPLSTIEVSNQSEAGLATQMSMEITKIREENKLLNVQIDVLLTKITHLEVMNDRLQKQYTDIRGELLRRKLDFIGELAQHREVIFLLESRIALNREIRAFGKQIKASESVSSSDN